MLVAECDKNVVSNKTCLLARLLKVWKSVERSFWLIASLSFMRKAFLQQKAKEDVREIALYIADDNLKVAEAFRVALESARLTLADLPEIGRAYDFGNRELKGLRVLPVPDFPKYLVFYVYREPEEEVEIFRVLHGARDIPALFL